VSGAEAVNEREALLRAVCENPDEDTPRLVFADWLQENGDEARAEFIRLQIRFARGNYLPSEEARLKRRLKKLNAHTKQWELEVTGTEYVRLVRGFIEQAWFPRVEDFEQALTAAPLRDALIRGPVNLVAIMRHSRACRLHSLDLTQTSIQTSDLEMFAETDWPNHPTRLYLPERAPDELWQRVSSRFGTWAWFQRW
jgi:uncharacterized protein (TIGR02996 family)